MKIVFEGGIPFGKRTEAEKRLRDEFGIALAAFDPDKALLHMRHATVRNEFMRDLTNYVGVVVEFAVVGHETVETMLDGTKYESHEKGFWRELR